MNWRAERVPARRDYFLGHAKDDWINVGRAMAVRLDDVIAQLREGGHDFACDTLNELSTVGGVVSAIRTGTNRSSNASMFDHSNVVSAPESK